MSPSKPSPKKTTASPDARGPVPAKPSRQAAPKADEAAKPSAKGAAKVKNYSPDPASNESQGGETSPTVKGTIQQVGSARIEALHDTDYVVTAALSANQYVLVADHGKGKAELWMGHKNPPASYCIKYGPLYLEFVRTLSSEDPAAVKPAPSPAPKFKKLVPGVRVRVVDGSGLDSGREGVVVPNSEAYRLNRQPAGKPSWPENRYGTQYGEPGRYKDFDPSRELIVKDDAGVYFGMFKDRLIAVDDIPAWKAQAPAASRPVESEGEQATAPQPPGTYQGFGLVNRIPVDSVEVAWGGRAVWDRNGINVYPDRQETWGGEDCQRKSLHAWINAVGLPWLIKEAPEQLNPATAKEIEFKQHGFRLIADTNGSHGYIHIAATMPKSDDTAGAKWSGKEPIPAVGTRVNVRMNGFGNGTVVGHFVQDGWAGVRVHLDALPDWYFRQEKERGRGADPVGLFFGVDLAPVKE